MRADRGSLPEAAAMLAGLYLAEEGEGEGLRLGDRGPGSAYCFDTHSMSLWGSQLL